MKTFILVPDENTSNSLLLEPTTSSSNPTSSANNNPSTSSAAASNANSAVSCPTCHEYFTSNNGLIDHALKEHCSYSGLICPYCKGSFPERFINLEVSLSNASSAVSKHVRLIEISITIDIFSISYRTSIFKTIDSYQTIVFSCL